MNLKKFVHAVNKFEATKVDALRRAVDSRGRGLIILLGNGGSNSICSHIAQDYTKALGKNAVAFSDPSRLTCYINDYGMENAYAQFVSEFAQEDSLVVLISSSGNSPNIINAAQKCRDLGVDFIILTGFNQKNKLRTHFKEYACNGLDIWVDSCDYGIVECAHQVFLHSIIGD